VVAELLGPCIARLPVSEGLLILYVLSEQALTGPALPHHPVLTRLRRLHHAIELDTLRIGRDAGHITEEIVQHLSALPSANVRVRLEIDAEMPNGAPDNVVRTVSENCRTLTFISWGFEEE
jgi:hypothetical protein